MWRADDEQNLGSPALQIICTPYTITNIYIYIIIDIPEKSKSGGYDHSRLDQSRPMYNGDPGDHLILSRSDDSEDHR